MVIRDIVTKMAIAVLTYLVPEFFGIDANQKFKADFAISNTIFYMFLIKI